LENKKGKRVEGMNGDRGFLGPAYPPEFKDCSRGVRHFSTDPAKSVQKLGCQFYWRPAGPIRFSTVTIAE
jgi:hypothetical protein